MTGRQQNSLCLFCFLPVSPSFVAAFAALGVSFPGACPGKDGFFILTKRQIKTGDNALLLTAFALAFSPVNPLSENDGGQREHCFTVIFAFGE